MRKLSLICLVLFTSAAGCGDSQTPASPTGRGPEIVATVVIDTCYSLQRGSSVLDSLCGRSSIVTISPSFVYPDVKTESNSVPSRKTRRLITGPAQWSFSDPHFRAALLPYFDGRPLSISISAAAGSGEGTLGSTAMSGSVDPFSVRWINLRGSFAATLDSDGFPILGTIEVKEGSVSIQDYSFRGAEGRADTEMRLSELPVEDDREPPVVDRPDLTREELRAAPPVLELGDKTLVFSKAVAAHSWFSPAFLLDILITEENFHYVDEVRMDFVWVVWESNVWEPEIRSIWNTYEFENNAGEGPTVPIGTEVDIVVGFVDINGDVRLMKATTEVQPNE